MCGIAGICMRDGQPAPEDQLRAMAAAIAHRGPDEEGFLWRGPVGLASRRLSIIDLAGGSQPIFNEEQTIGIVYNGEIYNYRELREDLERRGHRFTTHSDTEVIVHAYEERGPDCLRDLAGMFVLAIWDSRDDSVFVARDRFGKKPLFYFVGAHGLVFASELKALLNDPRLPHAIDRAALDEYLALGYVPGDRCILAGVRKLRPGHWLRWRDGRTTETCYWRPEVRPSLDEHDWLAETEAALRTAVRQRLRADVPLGVFLSGGIDSSAITAIACQELGRPVRTFSVGFAEQAYNELPYARLVAERYGTEHHEIIVRDEGVAVLEDLAWHLDEPFADPSALPTYYVCRAARQQLKVCLAGDGGDEIFAGYTRYLQAQRYAWADHIPAGVRDVVGAAVLAVSPAHVWGRGAVERLRTSGAARYAAQMSVFTPAERADLLVDSQPARAEERFAYAFNGYRRPLVSVLQQIDQEHYLPDDILVKVDRMSMQNSLELRAPLLDHRLVEIVNAAPERLKVERGVGKRLLRNIITPHLPPEILERRKMGFGIPIKHWFRGSLHGYARDLLLGRDSRAIGVVSRDAVERVLVQHQAGMRDFSRKIWSLLMLEHWCRRYRF
jgi:asparagine synthase (glutamine-hydrolysing)